MCYTDRFGLKNIYCKNSVSKDFNGNDNNISPINDLKGYIINNGFKDYSAEGVSSYFTYRYPIINLTMFNGIERLDTGSIVLDGKIYSYWKPCFREKRTNEREAISKVKLLILKSIQKIVKNKQVIGITLSGGLDSSLLLAMCRNLYPNRKIYTYSCGFYGDDEFKFSRQIAKKFSDKHKEIILGKEDFVGKNSITASLIKHKCAPLHPNEVALAYLEMEAKQDLCDVVLCGEGADDIFGGYGHNLRMYKTYNGELSNFFSYFINNYRYFTEKDRESILLPKYNVNIEKYYNVLHEINSPLVNKNKVLYFIQRIHTRGLIERGNNALSYNNFNDGFPYIDDDLVEYVNSLPFEMKVHWKGNDEPKNIEKLSYVEISEKYDITKYILKKVAEEYLPNNIIYRKKKGFPVPFDLWFKDDEKWNLDENIFKSKNISNFSGWKKFMLINLNMFVNIFNNYKI
jgi:asparagine synthetase B (glutamine-hydrolysing)